ncbi:Domain of uncharacterised function (DUF2825) [Rothia dentocariosa]|uniref:Domain of uncharacterized function (DUF2825) n=1 Tax=Rothia dentocariosa TaxID=2047 RepID=A0A3S5BUC4_9MICC|nr:Domain of uncharacterised function (DUF2825) [Rothia dentocariosa]
MSLIRPSTTGPRAHPAGAGNILSSGAAEATGGAHPRGCGEHCAISYRRSAIRGSSPRVRGTSALLGRAFEYEGLIPRVRGTYSGAAVSDKNRGLIPAGAGNIITPHAHPSFMWAHPAGAGNMLVWLARMLVPRAHPRGCGEHASSESSYDLREGSSPRVRGTFTTFNQFTGIFGLIPRVRGTSVIIMSL